MMTVSRYRERFEAAGVKVMTEDYDKMCLLNDKDRAYEYFSGMNGIDLPGYGALNFKADVLEQEVIIPNPPQNFCWIRASIILEDGTVLWTSELIAPGESSDPIVFTTPLAAGEYKNAILKYECFRMDEALTPLNGATTNLTLKVK